MIKKSKIQSISRRQFIGGAAGAAFVTGLNMSLPLPACAKTTTASGAVDEYGIGNIPAKSLYNFNIDYAPFTLNGRTGRATAVNGTVPAPLVRLREGDTVRLNVTNSMMDTKHSSIHWHGLIVPNRMDGVPGINFDGIQPGETYEYEFDVRQAGTYWYHSHSRFQEQTGTYGPIVIDPKEPEPFSYDRDYIVQLSDWSFTDPETIFANIKRSGDYYNYQKRTVWDFFDDVSEKGLGDTVNERMMWGKMRMMPIDLADVTASTYTYLVNGNSPDMNWTGIFNPGETIRLRFINAAAMSIFDVRIPGLDMQVVMVDGKKVKPVDIHEFRIGVAETYDVLVRPRQDKPFTIMAESLDRSGYARGTLSPEPGLSAPVPPLRPRPVRKMSDMGMMAGMDMSSGEMTAMKDMKDEDIAKMMSHDMSDMDHSKMNMKQDPNIPGPNGPKPFQEDKSNTNVVMVVTEPKDRLSDPGIGLGKDGWKVLTYKDLVSNEPQPYKPDVDREMTINLTANMERYMFSFDGKKFTEQDGPYLFRHNERLRLYLVNHTMMEHPIHLHGMWMQIENGNSHDKIPYKHTILMKPGEKLSALITPIEKGDWAFHCHLLYHMEAGMMQAVRVA
jgi:CopA family copper-resistance protein